MSQRRCQSAQERIRIIARAAVDLCGRGRERVSDRGGPVGDADTTRWIVRDELGGRVVSAVGSASGNDIYLAVTGKTQTESVSAQYHSPSTPVKDTRPRGRVSS